MFRTLTYRSVTFFTTLPFPPPYRRLIRHHGSMRRRSGASIDDVRVQNAFLSSEVSTTSLPPLHLIVLNYKLPNSVPKIWHRSKSLSPRSVPSQRLCRVRVFGDGGANRFYDLLDHIETEQDPMALRLAHIPDAICGDMDSIRPDVLQFYRSHNVPVIDRSEDQDSTDTQKCIEYLRAHHTSDDTAMLCIAGNGHEERCDAGVQCRLGALGGRLDHTLANLHTLHMYADMEIVMIGEGNCARLLHEGKTRILARTLLPSSTTHLSFGKGGSRGGRTQVCPGTSQWTCHCHSHRTAMASRYSQRKVVDVTDVPYR